VADDINLPNLVSHLAVTLDGLSGTVADAGRQGSSVGAALGGGIQRELQNLLAHLPTIDVDASTDEVDRDLARVRQQLDDLAGERIGVDVSIADALRRLEQLEPHLQRLSDTHPNINVQAVTRGALRQLEELRDAARRADDTDVQIDVDVDDERPRRLAGVLGRLTSAAGSAAGALAGVGKAAAGLGAAAPLVAGVVQTLAQVAPAAGVAVTGMAAVKLAQGAVQLASVGMDDALSAALDPSKAEEFSEALEKLSPNARAFATAVRDTAPALREMQQAVQDRVFDGLDGILREMAETTLPVLRNGLTNAGGAVNLMARNVGNAAIGLSKSGTLGRAISSANIGLFNLAQVPGQVVVALGQIAAAAGPSFERLTSAAGAAAEGISDRLSDAYESGAMQDAIERAIDVLKELLEVGGNVADIIGSIFKAMPSDGGGMVGVLQDVTAAIADVMQSAEVQGGLRELFQTMSTIGTTVAPLLAQALLAIAPVVQALGPPVQTLVTALGTALTPIIEALGPVLQAVAVAAGELIVAVSPLLTMFGELITALLPIVLPLFQALSEVFQEIAPVLQEVADALLGALAPILAQMPQFVQPFADMLARLAQVLLPVLADLIVQLAPGLAALGSAFGELLVAASPILEAFAKLAVLIIEMLMPVIQPLMGLITGLATVLAKILAGAISNVLVPVLEFLGKLLTGDFSGAWAMAKSAVGSAASWIRDRAVEIGRWVGQGVGAAIDWLKGMPARAGSALASLGRMIAAPALAAGKLLVQAIRDAIANAVTWVKGLPGQARAALGSIGSTLWNAGKDLIQGFIDGIKSMVGSVKSTLGGITDSLTSWKGPPAKDARILTPAGRLLIEGFIRGITDSTAKLRARLQSITKALPDNIKSGYGKTLAKATRELEKLVTRRDAVVKRLAAAEKKLKDLVAARGKAAADIRGGILDEANITTGRSDVNSVSAITVGLQQALKKTREFQANIAALKKAGLRSDLLQQIADAGVDAGGATASALAKATPAELKKINSLQGQLAASATATGNTVGDALYGAGIRAAQGLVAGLKTQEKAIEDAMRKIAQSMLAVIKKVHKTRSPSRAFAWIGEMDGRGLAEGFLATTDRVRSAARTVAGAALDAASGLRGAVSVTPTAAQLAQVYAGPAGGGERHITINLYGSDATPQGIVRELSWLGLVGRG
jgi:phage-related protein